ncbi:MAG: HEAT repeat domain-containing protein [Alphaproteobacteria bacterium]
MTGATSSDANYPGGELLFTMYQEAGELDRAKILPVIERAAYKSHDFAEVAVVKALSLIKAPDLGGQDSQLRYAGHKIIEAATKARPYLVTEALVNDVAIHAITDPIRESSQAARINLGNFVGNEPGRAIRQIEIAQAYYDHSDEDIRAHAMLVTAGLVRHNTALIDNILVDKVANFFVNKENIAIVDAAAGVVDSTLRAARAYSDRFQQVAIKALDNPDPGVRSSGLELITTTFIAGLEYADPQLVDRVIKVASEDPDFVLRRDALMLVRTVVVVRSKLHDTDRIDKIVQIAKADPNSNVRYDAITLIGEMRSEWTEPAPALIAGLKQVAKNDPDAKLRRHARSCVKKHSPAQESFYHAMREVLEPVGERWRELVTSAKANANARANAMSEPDAVTGDAPTGTIRNMVKHALKSFAKS